MLLKIYFSEEIKKMFYRQSYDDIWWMNIFKNDQTKSITRVPAGQRLRLEEEFKADIVRAHEGETPVSRAVALLYTRILNYLPKRVYPGLAEYPPSNIFRFRYILIRDIYIAKSVVIVWRRKKKERELRVFFKYVHEHRVVRV